jgi:hypothetical protein
MTAEGQEIFVARAEKVGVDLKRNRYVNRMHLVGMTTQLENLYTCNPPHPLTSTPASALL